MEKTMNKTVYVVWVENEETEPFICGIATNEERATKMIETMKKEFEDLFEYKITPITTDNITINDEDIFIA